MVSSFMVLLPDFCPGRTAYPPRPRLPGRSPVDNHREMGKVGRRLRRCSGALSAPLLACLLASSAHAATISPLPGTPDASPHTQISFLGVPAGEIHQISVVGSRTGSPRGGRGGGAS